MFRNSKFNQDISNWDVSNVKNMKSIFQESKFNKDISKWKLSKLQHEKNEIYEINDFDNKIYDDDDY